MLTAKKQELEAKAEHFFKLNEVREKNKKCIESSEFFFSVLNQKMEHFSTESRSKLENSRQQINELLKKMREELQDFETFSEQLEQAGVMMREAHQQTIDLNECLDTLTDELSNDQPMNSESFQDIGQRISRAQDKHTEILEIQEEIKKHPLFEDEMKSN